MRSASGISNAGDTFLDYLGLYIDALIQLGEFEQIMLVLDKAEKILDFSISVVMENEKIQASYENEGLDI